MTVFTLWRVNMWFQGVLAVSRKASRRQFFRKKTNIFERKHFVSEKKSHRFLTRRCPAKQKSSRFCSDFRPSLTFSWFGFLKFRSLPSRDQNRIVFPTRTKRSRRYNTALTEMLVCLFCPIRLVYKSFALIYFIFVSKARFHLKLKIFPLLRNQYFIFLKEKNLNLVQFWRQLSADLFSKIARWQRYPATAD